MHWARVLVLLLGLIEAGWMTFDGCRALLVGDYVTPTSGPYAGQIGAWSKLVGAAGIDPRGTPMKSLFAVYGLVWIVVLVNFALGARWAWSAMVGMAAGALWFLPFGTVASVVQLALLLVLRAKLR